MTTTKTKMLMALAVPIVLATGCSSQPAGPYGYTSSYLEARPVCDNSVSPSRESLLTFIDFYDRLDEPGVEERVEKIYADPLYFNDTLITLRDRESLRRHLAKTADSVDQLSVTLLDVLESAPASAGEDGVPGHAVYLLWEMEARFELLGKARLSHTLGISQLCFNAEGLVIFHQDFWDSSQGLDQHLPLIGPPTRWLRQHDNDH